MNMGTKMTKAGAFNDVSTLEQVVAAYRTHFSDRLGGGHDDPVVPYCREAKNLPDAIRKACDGRKPDGKMFAKGTCIVRASRDEFSDRLVKIAPTLRKAKNFEQLFDAIEGQKPWGVGRMLSYNVAERVAAFLDFHAGNRGDLLPKEYVYLHAGPLEGWKRLTGYKGGPTRVKFAELPAPLRTLSAIEIEDMFCEFRDVLRRGML